MNHVGGNVLAQTQTVRITPRRGTLLWILQRATSYGLAVFLTVHLLLFYFVGLGSDRSLSFATLQRYSEVLPVVFFVNELGLLVCGLFHGLNGVRTILYDLVTNPTARRIFSILLILVGLFFLYDGTRTLLVLGLHGSAVEPIFGK